MHQQHVNCLINTWVFAGKNTVVNSVQHGFYAIIKVKMSLHLHPHSTLCMRAANALVSLRISARSPDPFDAQYCDQNLTMLALFYELFISYIY